jgi:hypothetical protein
VNSSGGPNKWWVLVAIGVGTFMSALDGSVVNVVLPVVARAWRRSNGSSRSISSW